MDKIAALSDILAQNPNDAFARYGLAMEYSAQGEIEPSLREFGSLLSTHPDYTAGYFMCAQTLLRAGRISEAKTRLEQGITSARKSGNSHAESEMQSVLDDLA